MRPVARIGLIFAGLAVVCSGIWLLAAAAPGLRLSSLVLALGISLFIFRSSWRASVSSLLILAVTSVGLFFLNPLFFSYLLWTGNAYPLWDAFLATAFCSACFWLDHWSWLMRSLFLAVLYALSISLGSAAVFWIPLALLPWMFLSRRVSRALASQGTIVVGGTLLYGMSWLFVDLLGPGRWTWQGPFLGSLRQACRLWLEAFRAHPLGVESLSGEVLARIAYAGWLFSLPLLLLAILVTIHKGVPAFRARRTDPLSIQISMFWLVMIYWILNVAVGGPFGDGDLITAIALSAPLLIHLVEPRNFILSRHAQRILIVSAILNAIVTLGGLFLYSQSEARAPWLGLLLSAAAVAGSYGVSLLLARARQMNPSLRWAAIMVGSYVGFCFGFLSQFFKS